MKRSFSLSHCASLLGVWDGLKRWGRLIWLWAHVASALGRHRQRKQKRRFVFHRISVVRAKQCLAIDSLRACGHRLLSVFFFPEAAPITEGLLKRPCTSFFYSPAVFHGWSKCEPQVTHFNESNVYIVATELPTPELLVSWREIWIKKERDPARGAFHLKFLEQRSFFKDFDKIKE